MECTIRRLRKLFSNKTFDIFFTVFTQCFSNTGSRFPRSTPPPPPIPISPSFQFQRNFGWRYAIGCALRMFPELHVCLIIFLYCLGWYVSVTVRYDETVVVVGLAVKLAV